MFKPKVSMSSEFIRELLRKYNEAITFSKNIHKYLKLSEIGGAKTF